MYPQVPQQLMQQGGNAVSGIMGQARRLDPHMIFNQLRNIVQPLALGAGGTEVMPMFQKILNSINQGHADHIKGRSQTPAMPQAQNMGQYYGNLSQVQQQMPQFGGR